MTRLSDLLHTPAPPSASSVMCRAPNANRSVVVIVNDSPQPVLVKLSDWVLPKSPDTE
jgi:hypothetical protein